MAAAAAAALTAATAVATAIAVATATAAALATANDEAHRRRGRTRSRSGRGELAQPAPHPEATAADRAAAIALGGTGTAAPAVAMATGAVSVTTVMARGTDMLTGDLIGTAIAATAVAMTGTVAAAGTSAVALRPPARTRSHAGPAAKHRRHATQPLTLRGAAAVTGTVTATRVGTIESAAARPHHAQMKRASGPEARPRRPEKTRLRPLVSPHRGRGCSCNVGPSRWRRRPPRVGAVRARPTPLGPPDRWTRPRSWLRSRLRLSSPSSRRRSPFGASTV